MKIWHLISSSILNLFRLSLLALLFLNSCVSLQPLDIQIAKKEQFPLPEAIQSVVILNRAINTDFRDLTFGSLELFLNRKKLVLDTILCDFLSADTAIKVAAKALYESGRFDVVIPLQMNILRQNQIFTDAVLPSSFIKEMCHDFNTDAVLVLESFNERVATTFNRFSQSNQSEVKMRMIALAYNSVWRIYHPCDSCYTRRYDISDTIFYKSDGMEMRDINSNLPFLKEALIEGGINCGIKYVRYISPEWINYYREYYITRSKEIDAAIPLIKNNKWEEAAAIWLKYIAIPSLSIRSKVEFNLALASEMKGELDKAVLWCQKSIKTEFSIDKKIYLSALVKRLVEMEKENVKRKI